MRIQRWLKKRRDRRNREIARAVRAELGAEQSWEKFLPPVVLHDRMYMVTEGGSIYALELNDTDGMEHIIKIRTR